MKRKTKFDSSFGNESESRRFSSASTNSVVSPGILGNNDAVGYFNFWFNYALVQKVIATSGLIVKLANVTADRYLVCILVSYHYQAMRFQ